MRSLSMLLFAGVLKMSGVMERLFLRAKPSGHFVRLCFFLCELYLLIILLKDHPEIEGLAADESPDQHKATPPFASPPAGESFSDPANQPKASLSSAATGVPKTEQKGNVIPGLDSQEAAYNFATPSARIQQKRHEDFDLSGTEPQGGGSFETDGPPGGEGQEHRRHARLRGLAGYAYPGLGAGYYGAYLSWYRNVYIPWYYATYGLAVTPPLVTSPLVYNTYASGIVPAVQTPVVNTLQPVAPTAVLGAAPVVGSAAPTYAPAMAANPGVGRVPPGTSNLAPANATQQPAEALLSLQDNSSSPYNAVAGTPAVLTPQAYGAGPLPGPSGNNDYNSMPSDMRTSTRRQATSGGGLGGLGLMNFAAFLARPDGTLAAIGGNGQ